MPSIDLDNVGRVYGSAPAFVALDGVSLHIQQGEYVAIQGESGSGKSTLLGLVGLLDSPTRGSVLLNERPTRKSRRLLPAIRSNSFSYIFQAFHLLERRVALDSVALPLLYRGLNRTEQRSRAIAALETVGMGSFAYTPGRLLSGGQRQRVAIARALAAEAPILIADEPTGNLDSENTARVMDAIDLVNRNGSTVVLVTHSEEVATRAQRRIVISDGHVTHDSGAGAAPPGDRPRLGRRPPGRASVVRWSSMLRDACENVFSRLSRFLGLSAAVAIAVTLVLVTLGLSFTASRQVSDLFDATANTDVTIAKTVTAEDPPISSETLARLNDLNGVTAVADAVEYSAHVQTGQKREAVEAPWIHARGDLVRAARLELSDGSTFSADGLSGDEALLGSALATRLSVADLSYQPTIFVDGTPYVVVGIVEETSREADWVGAVITQPAPVEAAAEGENRTLLATSAGAASQVAGEAQLLINPYAPDAVDVATPPDPSIMRAGIEASVQSSLLILSLVAIAGSFATVVLASSVAASERRVELGLRRAVGARTRHIWTMLAVESLLVGILGAVTGLFAGVMTILAVTIANRWTPMFELQFAGLALLAGVGISVFGSLIGSVRAVRVEPNESLRPVQ